MICEDIYTEEELMYGIRRAMMGKAGEKLTRMGPGMTVKQVISTFESEYGYVHSKETVLGKLFNHKQSVKENITDYAARVEELYAQAVRLDGVKHGDSECLQNILYAGLRSEFSLRAAYKNDTIKDYAKFKLELQRIENDINKERQAEIETKKCSSAVNVDKEKPNTEIRNLMEQLNACIERLEKEKNELKEQLKQQSGQQVGQHCIYDQTGYPLGGFGSGHRRYNRGVRGFRPYRGHGRGNSQYEPR